MDIIERIDSLVNSLEQRGAEVSMLVLGIDEQIELKMHAQVYIDAPLSSIIGMEYQQMTILDGKRNSFLGAVVEEIAGKKASKESPVNNTQQRLKAGRRHCTTIANR